MINMVFFVKMIVINKRITQVTGQLEQGRVYAGVTEVPLSIVAHHCTF